MTLSGEDSQLANEDWETDMSILPGSSEKAASVTGETIELQVNESGALPEVADTIENLMKTGFLFQVTTNECWPEAK